MPAAARNETRFHEAIALVFVICGLLAASSAAAMAYCGSFTFGSLANENRTRQVERALARVYPSDATTTDHHSGAATVIHLHPMLLVTASHVVSGNTAKISFSGAVDNLYEAKVVARADQPNGYSGAKSLKYDLAVLLVKQPPTNGVSALEPWLDEIDKEALHDLVGYARDLPSPLWGRNGTLALYSECAWRLREATFNGDSGGAAVSQSGMIVGVIIDGRESGAFDGGAMGQATILPLVCAQDTILSALDQSEPAKDPSILDVDRSHLMHELQPPPSIDWIDNIEFARGLRDLMANRPLLKKLQSQGTIECPLFRSTLDRKLGFETAVQLIKYAYQDMKHAADVLKRIGDEEKADNAPLAKRLYASAGDAYTQYASTRLSVSGWQTVPVDVAQAILGRADVLASVSKIADDPASRYIAMAAAAHAVRVAPNDQSRGLAFAILGDSAFQSGDYQTAIKAFSSASKNGFSPVWVKKDYMEAFRLRDNVSDPASAKDFMVLGEYPPLSKDQVGALAGTVPLFAPE
jgi:hypothetical protein